MKKGLKFGVLALSLVAMATMILTTTETANAGLAKVEIIEGQNNCGDLADYNWGSTGASVDQINLGAISNPFHCTLLRDAAGAITIILPDLTGANTNAVIGSGNFTVVFEEASVTGSLAPSAQQAAQVFNQVRTIYSKDVHLVGEMSRNITLSGYINPGQPVDQYQSQLNITVPNT